MGNEFTDDDFASMQQLMQEEQTKQQFKSMYWKPANEGTYQIRLLTPLKQFNEKLFYEYHRIHYVITEHTSVLIKHLLIKMVMFMKQKVVHSVRSQNSCIVSLKEEMKSGISLED